MTEIKLYVSGEFQSEVCRSPDLSPLAPYWEFNGTPLNDDEINAYYGAIVSRDVSGEGHHLSTLSIQAVNLSLNATVISCLVNRTVVLQYHVTVGEWWGESPRTSPRISPRTSPCQQYRC